MRGRMTVNWRLWIAQVWLCASLIHSSGWAAATSHTDEKHALAAALRVEAHTCYDAEALTPSVARFLKRNTIDRHLELEIRGDPQSSDGVTLEVRRDGHVVGTRSFPAFTASCEDIRTAIAMSAAFVIDATELESQAKAPAASATPAQPKLAPGAPAATNAVMASLEALALTGVLPGWSAGVSPSIAYSWQPALAVRASLLATAKSSFSLDGGSVDTQALAGRLDACARLVMAPRVRACAGIVAGRYSAQATNLVGAQPAAEQHRLLAGGVVRLDLRAPLAGPLGLIAAADLFVRFTDSDVRVAGGGSRPLAPVGFVLGAGPEIAF
jgi:hypothetical protein